MENNNTVIDKEDEDSGVRVTESWKLGCHNPKAPNEGFYPVYTGGRPIHEVLQENSKESFCKQQIGVDIEIFGYHILVKAPVLEEKSAGGVILPESHIRDQQRRQYIGQILNIGPTAFSGNLEHRRCNIGDWISYSNFERVPEYIDDHVLYYITDAHVIARYSEEAVKKILRTGK